MNEDKKASGPSGKANTAERIITASAGIATILTLFLGIYTAFIQSTANPGPEPEPTPTVAVTEQPPADIRGLDDFADDDERLAYAADLIGHGWYDDAMIFLKSFQDAVEPGSEIELAVRFDLGLAHLYREDWNEAVNHLEVVAKRTNYPDAYYNLGRAYMGLNRTGPALEAFEKAMEIEPKPEYEAARDALLSGMEERPTTPAD